MTILYGLVARGKTVLCEFTVASGNFPTITRILLAKIDQASDARMSWVWDQHIFHYVVAHKITFLCMCDDPQTGRRRVPFEFLGDLQQQFFAMYGEAAQTAIAFAYNDEFGRVMQQRMEACNAPGTDAVGQVQAKLDDVKNVMVQNIENVLERGEKLELLVDKTDKLQHSAFSFHRSSKRLQRAMWLKKMKIYAILFLGAGLLILFISMMICGADFSKCHSDGSGDDDSQR